MNTQLAKYFLHQMGIEVWLSQQPLSGAPQNVDCVCYQLFQVRNGAMVGTLLVQNVLATPQQNHKIQNLMEAMLFAVDLQATIMSKPTRQGILVIWGLEVAQKILQVTQPLSELKQLCLQQVSTMPTMVSYHPSQLLEQPRLKAEAWQDLQALSRSIPSPRA